MTISLSPSPDAFASTVLGSTKPVLVDFYTQNCGSCVMLEPVLNSIADEYGDEIDVVKVDLGDFPDLSTAYAVMSVPTLLMFRGGEVTGRHKGERTRSAVARFVEQHLGEDA